MASRVRWQVWGAALVLFGGACGDGSSTRHVEQGAEVDAEVDSDSGDPEADEDGGESSADAGGQSSADAGPMDAGTSGADAGGARADAAPDADHLGKLGDLGAEVDLPIQPLGTDGKPLPTGYHPLRRNIAPINPRTEVYVAGPTFQGQREGLYDDGHVDSGDTPGVFQSLLTPNDPAWYANTFRAGGAVDVDGDGIQEIVVIYYVSATKTLFGKVIHGPKRGVAAHEELPFVLATNVTAPNVAPDWVQYAVGGANVDDDPAEELVVGFYDLYVFDDPAHEFEVLHFEALASHAMSVAVGDFDAVPVDTRDEFVVTYQSGGLAYYQMYDGLKKEFTPTGRPASTNRNDAAATQIRFAELFAVAGNFDGDAPDELAFLGSPDGSRGDDSHNLMLVDDRTTNFRWFNSFWDTLPFENVNLAAVDIDGDHRDELAAVYWIFDGLEKLPPSSSTAPVTDIFQRTDVGRTDMNLGYFYHVRGGNVRPLGDNNRRPAAEELVAIAGNRVVYGGYGPTGVFGWTDVGPASNVSHGDVLVLANVDEDSQIVRFDGEHELLYADPQIIVAMSAPPFYADTNQADSSSTSFGDGKATSSQSSTSVGYSVGFSFGYEAEDPLGIASASFKVSVEQSFNSVATSSWEREEYVTYSTGAEDSVVFTVVPFDVYYYTVVSAVDPKQVGRKLSINMPRKPQTLLASSEFFDRNVPAHLRSAQLFTHEVGDPHSYPTVVERDNACGNACFRSSEARAVGQGGGAVSIEINKGSGKGTGTEYEFSVTVESEVGVGGVTAGVSAGFSYGYSMETSTTQYTMFAGQIGSIQSFTPDMAYSAGLFAYRRRGAGGGQDLLMVDYWVE